MKASPPASEPAATASDAAGDDSAAAGDAATDSRRSVEASDPSSSPSLIRENNHHDSSSNGHSAENGGSSNGFHPERRLAESHPLLPDSTPSATPTDASVSGVSFGDSISVPEPPPPRRSPVVSLSPPDSETDVGAVVEPPRSLARLPPSSAFCPIELSPDTPTTPPYPPANDLPPPTLRVEALVHVSGIEEKGPELEEIDGEQEKPAEIIPEEQSSAVPSPASADSTAPSAASADSTAPSAASADSTAPSAPAVSASPAVRPKNSPRQVSNSSPSHLRPHISSHHRPRHISSSPPSRPRHASSSSSSSPPPQCRLSSAGSAESEASNTSLASPKRRQLLNRPLTSLVVVDVVASSKELFESFEGANYSFDSLPGVDDLNNFEMPHAKKMISAKQTFQTTAEASPTEELPGWHSSLAQRSLKYLDAPLSSAYEDPPVTFGAPVEKGLWGRSGDWELKTGTGAPVKGPEARSVAAAMAAMLYEEGYSDILPPQVGASSELRSLQSNENESPTSHHSGPRTPEDDDAGDEELWKRKCGVLSGNLVVNGSGPVLPTLHPEMQENFPRLPTARDMYERDLAGDISETDCDSLSLRRRLPSEDFKIFSGPSTPDEPPPTAFHE